MARSRRPQRLALVGHDAGGVEIPGRAKALASGQAPCGELNEKARGVISGTLMPQVDAGHAPREQPIAAVEGVDDDDVVGELQRGLDRFGEPALDARPHNQPIDDHVDRVVPAAVERDVVVERRELAVDARLA